jgi:O-methyltransferase
MNLARIKSADFFVGRALHLGRALLEILLLLARHPSRKSLSLAKLILAIKPKYTHVTNASLIRLHEIVGTVNELDLPGDILECGVWNGGSAALMAFTDFKRPSLHHTRTIWLYDSFEGLPPPTEKDGVRGQNTFFQGLDKGRVDMVHAAFRRLGVARDRYKIVEGWFDKTLISTPVDKIAVLHIDADWYESVKLALEQLYDKVVPGGFVILDDYGYWEGCTKATCEFLEERNLSGIEICRPTRYGAHFQKPIP